MPDTPGQSVMRGVIAYLTIENADAAMRFYGRAFDAKLWGQPARDDAGRILNASLLVNGGVVMLMEAMPDHGAPAARAGQGVLLQLVAHDGEAIFTRAAAAGCPSSSHSSAGSGAIAGASCGTRSGSTGP